MRTDHLKNIPKRFLDLTFTPPLQSLVEAVKDGIAGGNPHQKTIENLPLFHLKAKMFPPLPNPTGKMYPEPYAARKTFELPNTKESKSYQQDPILKFDGSGPNFFELPISEKDLKAKIAGKKMTAVLKIAQNLTTDDLPFKNTETAAFTGTPEAWFNLNEAVTCNSQIFKTALHLSNDEEIAYRAAAYLPEPPPSTAWCDAKKSELTVSYNPFFVTNKTEAEKSAKKKAVFLKKLSVILFQNEALSDAITSYGNTKVRQEEMKQKFAYLSQRLNMTAEIYDQILQTPNIKDRETGIKKLETDYQNILPFLAKVIKFSETALGENAPNVSNEFKTLFGKSEIPLKQSAKKLQFALREEAGELEQSVIGRLREIPRAHPKTAQITAGAAGVLAAAAHIGSYFIPGGFVLQCVTAPIALFCLGKAAPKVKEKLNDLFSALHHAGENTAKFIGRGSDKALNLFRKNNEKTDFSEKAAAITFNFVSGLLFTPLHTVTETVKNAFKQEKNVPNES